MKRSSIVLIVVLIIVFLTGNSSALEISKIGLVQTNGYVSQGYIYTNHNNFLADTEGHGTSQFTEAGINISSDVSKRLRLDIQFFAKDLGQMGNMEVKMGSAYADYSFSDWLKLRAGKIRIPNSFYTVERDFDMLRTFVFLPQSIYFEGWRDSLDALTGAGIFGYVSTGIPGNFEYHVYSGNANIEPECGVAKLFQKTVPPAMDLKVENINVNSTHISQLIWDTILGLDDLKIAASVLYLDFDIRSSFNNGNKLIYNGGTTPSDPTEVPNYTLARSETMTKVKNLTYNYSLEYTYGSTILAGEYNRNISEITPATSGSMKEYIADGWYASLTHRFSSWFEIGTYYSEYYPDIYDRDGKKKVAAGLNPPGQEHNNWVKDTCVATRFDMSPYWIFKLEGHSMNGSALMYDDDDNYDASGQHIDYEEDWYMVAAKLSYSF